MRLELVRKVYTETSTIGELRIGDDFECVTLEDPVRAKKIKGATAIAAGTYTLTISNSKKFGRKMPRLLNVPNFEGILIHWGNTAKDTEGCILVGKPKSKNFIGSSKATFNSLYKKIEAAAKTDTLMSIVVTDG